MIKAAAIAFVATIVMGAPSKGRAQETLAFDFEDSAEETLPGGFEAGMTGRWKPTRRGQGRARDSAGDDRSTEVDIYMSMIYV